MEDLDDLLPAAAAMAMLVLLFGLGGYMVTGSIIAAVALPVAGVAGHLARFGAGPVITWISWLLFIAGVLRASGVW